MQHNSLENYLKTNFTLKHMYNYSLTELENMMPWERDIIIDLIKEKRDREENG